MDPLQGSQEWFAGDQVDGPKLSPYPRECHTHGHACTAGGGRNTLDALKHIFAHSRCFMVKHYSHSGNAILGRYKLLWYDHYTVY